MLITENWKIPDLETALRGMRNSYDSWDKSDSYIEYRVSKLPGTTPDGEESAVNITIEYPVIGEVDLKLANNLEAGGPSDRKFLRQIPVSFDITAPLYFYKELDVYTVGKTQNSCSTMHTIQNKPITQDLFSTDHMSEEMLKAFNTYLKAIEKRRRAYLDSDKKDKQAWYDIIEALPSSWMQKRTVTMNYEVLYKIALERSGHRLDEWATFIHDAAAHCLYYKELIAIPVLREFENRKKVANYDKTMERLAVYKAIYGDIPEDQYNATLEGLQNTPIEENIPTVEEPIVVAIRTIKP